MLCSLMTGRVAMRRSQLDFPLSGTPKLWIKLLKYYHNMQPYCHAALWIARKPAPTYDEYFYFYFIPTWRVISTTISGFLFTRQFRRYAILRVKPSAYRIPFFRTSSWWLWCVVGGRVVVCGLWLCVGAQNRGCAKKKQKNPSCRNTTVVSDPLGLH